MIRTPSRLCLYQSIGHPQTACRKQIKGERGRRSAAKERSHLVRSSSCTYAIEQRRSARLEGPSGKALPILRIGQMLATARRNPEDSRRPRPALVPTQTTRRPLRLMRRGPTDPSPSGRVQRTAHRALVGIPKPLFIPANALDPLRAHQHGDAFGRQIERAQGELAGDREWRVC
jgi:hypothetical protein